MEANPAVAVPSSYWEADVTSPGSMSPLVVLASPVSAIKVKEILPHQQLFDSPIVGLSSNPELSTGLASCLRRRRNETEARTALRVSKRGSATLVERGISYPLISDHQLCNKQFQLIHPFSLTSL
jgi:hypothetical protein